MDDHRQVKGETWRTKVFVIAVISLLIAGSVAFVLSIIYFGVLGLFSLLGIEFDSLWSLFLFVLFYFLIGIIGDFIVIALSVLMSKSYNWSRWQIKTGQFIFSFLVNWAIVSLLNTCMDSIHLQFITEMVLSLIFAIIDVAMESDEE
ncbi:YrvL family regulatory protein [Bacillus xiapuensis]|uniref:YrvL family regulatory protein n=1 Tax=Bacillus xiapuensis TaxID=2014075 RepID=UPI0012FD5686|nr:YrvL family regulatory protein [Bacillus xiapuensis]